MHSLLVSLVFCAAAVSYTQSKQIIRIGAIVPGYNPDLYCFESAINAAVDLINNDTTILRNYEIKIQFGRTIFIGDAMNVYYLMTKNKQPVQLLLGPAYSTETLPVALLSSSQHIPQISYSALSTFDTKNGETQFPYLIRTTPTEKHFMEAKATMMKHFKWKRVSIMYDERISLGKNMILTTELKKVGVQVLSNTPIHYDKRYVASNARKFKLLVDTLQVLDARVFIVMVGADTLKELFCEVYHRKLYGPKYQWIHAQGYTSKWYKLKNTASQDRLLMKHNCTEDRLLEAAENLITYGRFPLAETTEKTIAGLTPKEGWALIKEYKVKKWNYYYRRRKKIPPMPSRHYYIDSTYAFDAMYVAALGLNQTLPDKETTNTSWKYTAERAHKLTKTLLQSNFLGLSGEISFNAQTEERYASVLIQQIRIKRQYDYAVGVYKITGESRTAVGKFNTKTKQISFFEKPPGLSLFRELKIPKDGVLIRRIESPYSIVLIATMWSIAAVGIFKSLFFFFVNVYHRNEKLVKMSSPNINNGILLGCILCFSSIFVYGLDGRILPTDKLKYSCNAFVLTISIGFTLSFGCLFSKTWRIYKIFTAVKSMNRVRIQDLHLYATILVMLLVDVSLFIAWMFISPYHIKEVDYKSERLGDEIKQYYYSRCDCKYQLHFTIVMFGYKGFLLIFGLFLAWETRKVKVAVLNDSKMIGLAIYNVAIIATIGAVGTFALYHTSYYSTGFIVISLSIFLCTFPTVSLVFLPKVRVLYSGSYQKRERAVSHMGLASSKYVDQRFSNSSTLSHFSPPYER